MIRRYAPEITACLLLVSVLSSAGRGGELADQIKQTTDQILSIVQDPALKDPNQAAERRRRIMKIVGERFDWQAMARSALGRHWRDLTAAQQKEFVGLFSQLVERNYMAKVEDYAGEKIVYKGEKVNMKYGAADVVITTTRGSEIPVTYHLLKQGQTWRVCDVVIEGVSLINNYRSQIGTILDKSSYAELVKKIRATLDQNDSGPSQPSLPPRSPEAEKKG